LVNFHYCEVKFPMMARRKDDTREAFRTDDDHSTAPERENQRDQSTVVMVPISSLLPSDSPRLAGEHDGHSRALAESEATFPPIIVNRATMRVIDGMHRLRAAVLRGEDEIPAQFFDGDEVDAFALAVETNIAHGLPLSLADRRAAAARIVGSRPQWSDRAIASMTGLAAKTVVSIRRRSTEENPQSNSRVGRDGRVRPPNTTEGRRIASELMADQPDASLREIARAAGISLGTAHDVRKRIRRSEILTPSKRREGDQRRDQLKHDEPANRHDSKIVRRTTVTDRALILQSLKRDPSLRLTDVGRILIRLLQALAIDTNGWDRLTDNVPAHCTPMVSDAARACADAWQEFAEQLEGR
jgi:ParB-like chromosome segregation protein Spo0J